MPLPRTKLVEGLSDTSTIEIVTLREASAMSHQEFSDDDMAVPNKSPEPTAVGAVSSAVAVHATSRRWLSFLR